MPTPSRLAPGGLDSLGAVELRNAVAERFGLELPPTAVFDHPTPARLAALVVDQLAAAARRTSIGGTSAPRRAASTISSSGSSVPAERAVASRASSTLAMTMPRMLLK